MEKKAKSQSVESRKKAATYASEEWQRKYNIMEEHVM
jgi:hypothetical protein